MSSINSIRKLQILYIRMKNKKIKNVKNGEKKWPDTGIYTYYYHQKAYQILFKNVPVKAMFTVSVFEILLFEDRSPIDYHPPIRIQRAKGLTAVLPECLF